MCDPAVKQEKPDVNESDLNDTQLRVESSHIDQSIVETNIAVKEAANNNGDNDNGTGHQNGVDEATVDIFYMKADKRRELLLYLNRMEDTNLMCVLDSGSAVNVLTNKLLFDEGIQMVK